MQIFINVKIKSLLTNSNINKIDENHYNIFIKSKPIKGKANQELIENLSKYFNISKQNIKIVKGLKSKNKIVEIKLS